MTTSGLVYLTKFFDTTEETINKLKKTMTIMKYKSDICEELYILYKDMLLNNQKNMYDKPVQPNTKKVPCCSLLKKPKRYIAPPQITLYHVVYKNDRRNIFTRRYKALQNILHLVEKNEGMDIHSFTVETTSADKSIHTDDRIDVIQKELINAISECEAYCNVSKQLVHKT